GGPPRSLRGGRVGPPRSRRTGPKRPAGSREASVTAARGRVRTDPEAVKDGGMRLNLDGAVTGIGVGGGGGKQARGRCGGGGRMGVLTRSWRGVEDRAWERSRRLPPPQPSPAGGGGGGQAQGAAERAGHGDG